MTRPFDKYYQGELAYLRDMGRAFASTHPALAGLLAERGTDPDVERLLEGFAFLSARLRQRIDDSIPEMVEHLVAIVLPHYLRTMPACTLVEFTPARGAVRGRVTLPTGTPIASRPVDGTPCLFRTTQPVDLLPLRLVAQSVDDPGTSSPRLSLDFEVGSGGHAAVFAPAGLRLHFHGELASASHLYLWLARHCRRVVVEGEDGTRVVLPPTAIRPVGFEPEHALVPWPRASNDAYRWLVELFTLPSKFLFLDVVGLEAAAAITSPRFSMRFELDRPPPLPTRMPNDVVRLFAAPAVNLFRTNADPIRGDGTTRAALVRASGVDPAHMEVFSVDSVIGLVARTGERRTYHPFHAFSHTARREDADAYYVVHREPSPVDDGIHLFVGLGTPRDARPRFEEETLSLEVTCTHRSLPQALRVGDVCVPTTATPSGLKFTNIGLVSKPVRPPLGGTLADRLVSHLALHRKSLAEPEALRALLALYNGQERSDEPQGRANRRRIDALRDVSSRTVTRIVRGSPARGIGLALDLDESAFGSQGEAFLFAEVVERVLAAHVPVHSFTQLSAVLSPSGARLEWPPRTGVIPLI